MSGGGKGGGSTSTTQIPDWVAEPSKRNLERAETVQKMEFQPWTGLDVAAQTPSQQMANQMTYNSAQAFGMMPQGANMDANAGMPQAQTMGGVTGYSSLPMYDLAVKEAQLRDPRTAAIREELYK
jgi:hypothetical protein